jgi:hypothetical protein
LTLPDFPRMPEVRLTPQVVGTARTGSGDVTILRAEQISSAVETVVRREQINANDRFTRTALTGMSDGPSGPSGTGSVIDGGAPRLGSSYRRTSLRTSRAGQARDRS